MKRMLGIILGLSVAAPAGLATGCGHGCNSMLPYCALDLALVHQQWEPGRYAFHLTLDGEEVTCVADLPLVEEEPDLGCDSERVSLPKWGPHWDANREWPGVVSISGSPQEVEIEVEREGVELGQTSIRPHYEITEPNGEGCGFCENDDAFFAF